VEVLDAAGNRVTTATDSLTLTLTGPVGFTPLTLNIPLVNGVATFLLGSTPITTAGSFII